MLIASASNPIRTAHRDRSNVFLSVPRGCKDFSEAAAMKDAIRLDLSMRLMRSMRPMLTVRPIRSERSMGSVKSEHSVDSVKSVGSPSFPSPIRQSVVSSVLSVLTDSIRSSSFVPDIVNGSLDGLNCGNTGKEFPSGVVMCGDGILCAW